MKTSYDSHNPAAVRKRLLVPKTSMSDDSLSIDYNSSSNRILVVHTDSADDLQQLQADEDGVYYHVKEGGVWRTIPQALRAGGTGASNIASALQNLEMAYTNGEIYAVSGATPLFGYISENATQLWFTVVTPKIMRAGSISRVTINSLSAILRGNKGYLDSNNTARNLKASPFNPAAIRLSANMIRIIVTKSSAFKNVDNNTPISLQATFSLTFNA